MGGGLLGREEDKLNIMLVKFTIKICLKPQYLLLYKVSAPLFLYGLALCVLVRNTVGC